jgi:hypothetical protein
MQFLVATKFECEGEFVEFIRNSEGKRRLILRLESGDTEFKLPKEIRQLFEPRLQPGQSVAVRGLEERDRFTGLIKRVIRDLRLLGKPRPDSARRRSLIEVCGKKNCWKKGGRELWQTAEAALDEVGGGEFLRLKTVGCMDACDHAPNLCFDGDLIKHCTTRQARAMVEQACAAGKVPLRP